MNSQVIHEINPEGTSGLWRVGFMEKKGFEARMKEWRGSSQILPALSDSLVVQYADIPPPQSALLSYYSNWTYHTSHGSVRVL